MATVDYLGAAQRLVLSALKASGRMTIGELAAQLDVSREAVRKQLGGLLRDRLVGRFAVRTAGRAGRPASHYALTAAGENLFAEDHGALSAALVDAVGERLGQPSLHEVLGALADAKVARWASRLEGKPLGERVDALREIYVEADPFTSVESAFDGYRLVERNCPHLGAALERPVVCSITVNALTRLLGRRVVREERFQEGDGRCVFRIYASRRVDAGELGFTVEPPESAGSG